MKSKPSFITANFVARELQWSMTQGWAQGQAASEAWFQPEDTFAERFEAMLVPVAAAGFSSIDLWLGHLGPSWATDRQISEAHRILTAMKLKVISLAGWVPSDLSIQNRVVEIAHRLGTDLFAGNWEMLTVNRQECVRFLRNAGLRLAYENHPETSADQILEKIGSDDSDVLGVAVDTGWFASQGADALAQLKALEPRVFQVHLKDIRTPKKDGSGTLKGMGHQTCILGQGIVGISSLYRWVREHLPKVPLAIEHEPEDHDPLPDIQEGLRYLELLNLPRVRTAFLGCGNIAKTYLEQLKGFDPIEVVGFFDLDPQRSQGFASKYGGRAYGSETEVVSDPTVELVVNLTVPAAHFESTARALSAGKHVFSEKPFAPTAKQARELSALARERGVCLASAPITYLGEGQEAALAVVRSGALGSLRLAYAELNQGPIESWHPAPESFYEVGILWDVGIYPLTLLVQSLGPVVQVEALGRTLKPHRQRLDGTPFEIHRPDWMLAMLGFASGAQVRLTANYYASRNRQGTSLEFHGDNGHVYLASSYLFDARVERTLVGLETEDLSPPESFPGVEFARGVKEFVSTIRLGKSRLASLEIAEHVIQVLEAVERSLEEAQPVSVESGAFREMAGTAPLYSPEASLRSSRR
jgi:predicted dehydrogenase/sugar phosphate isomerase/epimerase